MSVMTYTVARSGDAWVIREGGNEYQGYKSQRSALAAATSIATKLGSNGHDTFVILQGTDGVSRTMFASDPLPPTIESMAGDEP